jgi:hypothetical protein
MGLVTCRVEKVFHTAIYGKIEIFVLSKIHLKIELIPLTHKPETYGQRFPPDMKNVVENYQSSSVAPVWISHI